MIEIKIYNGRWEAYVDGSLFTYGDSLQKVIDLLQINADELQDEILSNL
jgi:hypothetical protein